MRPANQPNVINAGAVSGTTPVTSKPIKCGFLVCATAQATFSSNGIAGTLKLQGSNDADGPNAPVNWNDIPNATTSVTAGAVACTPPTAAPVCWNWLQVVFIPSAGSGTVSVNLQTFGV